MGVEFSEVVKGGWVLNVLRKGEDDDDLHASYRDHP